MPADRMPPFSSLTVERDRCQMRSTLGRRWTITFFDANGTRLGLSFVPLRSRRLRETLVDCGWPVVVTRLRLGDLWRMGPRIEYGQDDGDA